MVIFKIMKMMSPAAKPIRLQTSQTVSCCRNCMMPYQKHGAFSPEPRFGLKDDAVGNAPRKEEQHGQKQQNERQFRVELKKGSVRTVIELFHGDNSS